MTSPTEDDYAPTCRTCGQTYPYAGDGWDGECPECADRTEAVRERDEARAEVERLRARNLELRVAIRNVAGMEDPVTRGNIAHRALTDER